MASTRPPKKESLKETLKHSFDKEKYLINLIYDPDTNTYERYDSWTALSKENIYRMGYKDAVKFHDDLRYSGVKTYVRLSGFSEADQPNKETSSTLADFWYSDAARDFQKGLTQTKFASLDMKQIMVMIPVVIGLVLGIFFLFGNR